MKNQIAMFENATNSNRKEKWKIQKWRKSLQKYCDDQSQSTGEYNGYCVCGNMKYCDLCDNSAKPNPCVIAIKKWCDIRGYKIDYNNMDFEKLIERIEK